MKMRIILVVLLSVSVLNAAIITVDNKYPYAGDYRTLQEAHDAASDGDIIYVSPSLVPYNAITVTKLLTVYGVGFEITENIGEPFTPTSILNGEINFNEGSSGSQIEGFDGSFTIYFAFRTHHTQKAQLCQSTIDTHINCLAIPWMRH